MTHPICRQYSRHIALPARRHQDHRLYRLQSDGVPPAAIPEPRIISLLLMR